MARSRKRSIAQTVTVLSSTICDAALDNLTPDQRASLTSDDTGTIIHASIELATKIGGILEERATDGR
jgi:hypothetical protein